MPPSDRSARTRLDGCPGVLAVHQAADGGLARVRLPGGVLDANQLRVLAAATADLGDGNLELTSRANVQIRALRPGAPQELSDRLHNAGLLPSITHERVRNIIASPLSGLDHHSRYDVLPAAAELDRLLCAGPELAELPGRFLFALDDGRNDLAGLDADVAVRALPDGRAALTLAGSGTGIVLAGDRIAGTMVDAARAFLTERAAAGPTTTGPTTTGPTAAGSQAADSTAAGSQAAGSQAWRLAELSNGPARVAARLATTVHPLPVRSEAMTEAVTGAARLGPHDQENGLVALVVAPALGLLTADQAALLADSAAGGPRDLRVTPWRSVVLANLPRRRADEILPRLAAAGLVTDPRSPWVGVTACAGRPGCAKSLADVRADARRVTPSLPAGRPIVHWAGCERRCGRPTGEHLDIVATGNGYLVDGTAAGAGIGAAIAARGTS